MKRVLGISGSPVKDSNTDLLVKTIMDASGVEGEFVKLSSIHISPCMACKKCAYTNQCVLDDDFKWLSGKVLNADALVIGTPVMYGSASAFTKSFVERLWSLRHVKLLTQGKIGATAVVGWFNTQTVSEWLNNVLMIGQIEVVGSVIGYGTPGCFTCGPGETCSHSIMNGAKLMKIMIQKMDTEGEVNLEEIEKIERVYEGYLEELPDNDPFKNPSYKILKCMSVKDQPEVMEKAVNIGKTISAKLEKIN